MNDQREKIRDEALSWQGTPYYHGVCLKGTGVSCSLYIAAVFNKVLNLSLAVKEHNEQWFLEDGQSEIYLEELKDQGFIEIPLEKVELSDLVISRTNSRVYCHGGIILGWPKVIHVIMGRGVHINHSAYASWYFGQNPDSLKFFSWKDWHNV